MNNISRMANLMDALATTFASSTTGKLTLTAELSTGSNKTPSVRIRNEGHRGEEAPHCNLFEITENTTGHYTASFYTGHPPEYTEIAEITLPTAEDLNLFFQIWLKGQFTHRGIPKNTNFSAYTGYLTYNNEHGSAIIRVIKNNILSTYLSYIDHKQGTKP